MLKLVILVFLCIAVAWGLVRESAFAQGNASTLKAGQAGEFRFEIPVGLNAKEYYVPADNSMTSDKVELGRSLFFDVRLSRDNTVSCATCHSPQTAFTDNQRVAVGVDARAGIRNTPTIINRAFSRRQFWDGRADSLEEQSKEPLIDQREMGMPSLQQVVKKLRAIEGYKRWFKRVFGRQVQINDVARSIAAFERTVVSGNSSFDQYRAGNLQALSASEKRGFEIFSGKARCNQCHSGSNFTDEKYHNLGVDWEDAAVDIGRYRVTKNREDIGAFKTPTLRDIAETAPYMHNGAFATLEETVAFYNRGGIANPFLDVEMRRSLRTLEETLEFFENKSQLDKRSPTADLARLDLTQQEQTDLVAFMRTLSGQGWQQIGPPDSFPQ